MAGICFILVTFHLTLFVWLNVYTDAIVLSIFSPNRRTHGGRKLWESKDDRKWGHDKFEEMSLHERHHEEVIVVYINILHSVVL